MRGGPGAPLTYFNDEGVRVIFFGSDILAKTDFLGSMKDVGNFGSQKKQRDLFWVARKGLRDSLGYAKKIVIFWVDKF